MRTIRSRTPHLVLVVIDTLDLGLVGDEVVVTVILQVGGGHLGLATPGPVHRRRMAGQHWRLRRWGRRR